MKKVCILLALVLLLSVSSSAWAEEDTWVEVIKMDGISVVVLGDSTLMMSENSSFNADGAGEAKTGFTLPKFLTKIGERAFEGIAAARVDVSENVEAIGPYAFAKCENLRTVTIPASVKKIDETAFDECHDITIYGTKGTAAETIAEHYGFVFNDPDEVTEPQSGLIFPEPPVLPPVSLR